MDDTLTSMSTPLRRSARIAARNAAQALKDMPDQHHYSHEYRVAVELITKHKEATTEMDKVETISTVFLWILYNPELLKEIPGFSNVVKKKADELYSQAIHSSGAILRSAKTKSEKDSYNAILLFGAYSKMVVYIQMTLHLIKKIDI